MIYRLASHVAAIEIKAGYTLSKSHFQGLKKLHKVLGDTIAGEVLDVEILPILGRAGSRPGRDEGQPPPYSEMSGTISE